MADSRLNAILTIQTAQARAELAQVSTGAKKTGKDLTDMAKGADAGIKTVSADMDALAKKTLEPAIKQVEELEKAYEDLGKAAETAAEEAAKADVEPEEKGPRRAANGQFARKDSDNPSANVTNSAASRQAMLDMGKAAGLDAQALAALDRQMRLNAQDTEQLTGKTKKATESLGQQFKNIPNMLKDLGGNNQFFTGKLEEGFKNLSKGAEVTGGVMGSIVGKFAGAGAAIVNVAQVATGAANAFQGMIDEFKNNPFIHAAIEAQRMETSLRSLMGSTEKTKDRIIELGKVADSTPFEMKDLVDADVQLRTFQQSAERFLPIAITLASVTGRTVPEAALAMGEALDGVSTGVTMLQRSFRITRQDLKEAGADIDATTGAIANKTVENQEHMANALEKASGKFGNIAQEQAKTLGGTLSTMEDAFHRLEASIGLALAPAAIEMTKFVAAGVHAASEFVPAFEEIIKILGDVASVPGVIALALGGLASAFIYATSTSAGFAAALGAEVGIYELFIAATVGAAGAVEAFTVACESGLVAAGALAAILTAGAAGIAVWERNFESTTTTAKKYHDELSNSINTGMKYKDMLGKTAEELRAEGRTSEDVAAKLAALRAQREEMAADKEGWFWNAKSTEDVSKIDGVIHSLEGVKEGMKQTEQAAGETASQIASGAEDATRAWTKFQLDKKKHEFDSTADEAAALDKVVQLNVDALARIQKAQKAAEASGESKEVQDKLEKRRAEAFENVKQASEEQTETHRAALEKQWAYDQAHESREVALGHESTEQQIEQMKALAADPTFAKMKEQQRDLAEETAVNEINLAQKVEESQIETQKSATAALAARMEVAKHAISLGVDVTANETKLAALTKQKYTEEIAEIKRKNAADIEAEKSTEIKAEIEKRGIDQVNAKIAEQKVAERALAQEKRDAASEAIKSNAAVLQSEQALTAATLENLSKRQGRGEDVSAKINAIKQVEQAQAEQALKQRESEELLTAKGAENAGERANIEKRYANELQALRLKYTDEATEREIDNVKRVQERKLATVQNEAAGIANRRAALEAEEAAGNRSLAQNQKMVAIEKEELKTKLDELNIQEKIDEAGVSPEKKATLEASYRAKREAAEIETNKKIVDLQLAGVKMVAESQIKAIEAQSGALANKKALLEEDISLGMTGVDIQKRQTAIIKEELALKQKELAAQEKVAEAEASDNDKASVRIDYQNKLNAAIIEARVAIENMNKEYSGGNSEIDKQIKKIERLKKLLGEKTDAEPSLPDTYDTDPDALRLQIQRDQQNLASMQKNQAVSQTSDLGSSYNSAQAAARAAYQAANPDASQADVNKAVNQQLGQQNSPVAPTAPTAPTGTITNPGSADSGMMNLKDAVDAMNADKSANAPKADPTAILGSILTELQRQTKYVMDQGGANKSPGTPYSNLDQPLSDSTSKG